VRAFVEGSPPDGSRPANDASRWERGGGGLGFGVEGLGLIMTLVGGSEEAAEKSDLAKLEKTDLTKHCLMALR